MAIIHVYFNDGARIKKKGLEKVYYGEASTV